MNNVPINFDQLDKLTDNNQSFANELLNMFAFELPSIKTRIAIAHANNDLEQLDQVIHKLYGSCCYCGANKLQELAKEAQLQLKQRNQMAISGLVLAINQEIVNILDHLSNI